MGRERMRTDSPLSRRIVTAFLGFLTSSVEPGPGVDLEGLEVAKECLADVFKINPSVEANEHDDLVGLFKSLEIVEQQENESNVSRRNLSADAPNTSSARTTSLSNDAKASKTLGEDSTGEVPDLGISEDELFGQFFGALERIRYFKRTADGNDDQDQLERTSRFFYSAVMELKNSGCQLINAKNLAETFKSQGNKSLQAKQYSDAIELYTCAIALCEDNAVYYCNRAAAYTQIHKFGEAISDSLKSIQIDPNYGKAYSRLGFAYYAQGNYQDAINKGFMRALQLDPNNESVKENIRAAEQKLREQGRNGHYHQSYGYSTSGAHQETGQHSSAAGSMNQTVPPPFTSMPFNINGLPGDFGNMFMNMGSNIPQGPFSQEGQRAPTDGNTFSEPEIRAGNININLGEQMPADISGALRSVMQMFSGTNPNANGQDDHNNSADGGSVPR